MIDIIIPAISIPKAIIGNDFFILMSVRAAISAPVQPPVPGRGIATNKSRPQSRQRLIFSLFLIERISSFSMIFENTGLSRRNWNILRMKSRMNGIGRMLPI